MTTSDTALCAPCMQCILTCMKITNLYHNTHCIAFQFTVTSMKCTLTLYQASRNVPHQKIKLSHKKTFWHIDTDDYAFTTRERKHPYQIFSQTNYGKFFTTNKIVKIIIWNSIPLNIKHSSSVKIFTKCSGKFDCLVKEMLYIRMRKPTLNVQTDSIRAKVFVWPFIVISVLILYFSLFAYDLTSLLIMESRWPRNVEQ